MDHLLSHKSTETPLLLWGQLSQVPLQRRDPIHINGSFQVLKSLFKRSVVNILPVSSSGLHEMTLHDCCHRWWGLCPWNRQWYSGVVLHIQKAVRCWITVQSETGYVSRFVSCSDKKWHQTTVPSVWCHNWFTWLLLSCTVHNSARVIIVP